MEAFCFTLAVFGFWVLLGRAVLSLCPTGLPSLQEWLLSPAVGLSALLLPVFWINRAGVPVKDFGVPLVLGLAAFSGGVLFYKRPDTPRRELGIAAGILLGALIFAAWPMFRFGFAWVSFCNDDMANYCLAADRFLNHGFFEGPNLEDYLQGKDYKQALWFAYAAGVRPGSELILATACSFLGPKSAHQAFMPVVAGLHLSLLSATGAMALASPGKNSRSFVAIGMTAISSLTILGFLYQLIAQVGGLTLLIASSCLFLRTFYKRQNQNLSNKLISTIPNALVTTALTIYYPEVLPFLAMGFCVFSLAYIIWKKELRTPFVTTNIITLIQIIILGNTNLFTCFNFLVSQAKGSVSKIDLTQLAFPYFVIPSGLPKFWGFLGLTEGKNEPTTSILICAAITIFAYYLIKVLPKSLQRESPSACVLLGQLLIALFLFYKKADFGLFKLAMYFQPFLWCSVAENIHKFPKSKIGFPLFSLILIANIPIGLKYVDESTGSLDKSLGFVQISSATRTHLITKLKNFFQDPNNKNYTIVVPSSNIVLAKFTSLYSSGNNCHFIAKPFFNNLIDIGKNKYPSIVRSALGKQRIQKLKNGNSFSSEDIPKKKNSGFRYLSFPQVQELPINRLNRTGSDILECSASPIQQLAFIESAYGRFYYVVGEQRRDNIAIFKPENDPYFPQNYFCALGEHILFQVFSKNKRPRILLEITTSPLISAGAEKLPTVKLNNVDFGFKGNGAARLVSEPINLEKVGQEFYLSMDIPNQAKQFPIMRSLIQSIYSKNISDDFRRITAFCRNIEILDANNYDHNNFNIPTEVKNFPADLSNKSLEFSGIFEDGWLSENSVWKLRPQETHSTLQIKGFIPRISDDSFNTFINIKIDGSLAYKKRHSIGNFLIELPVKGTFVRTIEINISNAQILPNKDGRQIGAKLNYIGFK